MKRNYIILFVLVILIIVLIIIRITIQNKIEYDQIEVQIKERNTN